MNHVNPTAITTRAASAVLCAVATLAAACVLPSCAVVPFVPEIAHAVPRMLFPGQDPNAPDANAKKAKPPDPPDPAIEHAIVQAPPAEGDLGTSIDQQDRVAFVPTSPGSIPVRITAVDLVGDVKARAVGDIVTVNVVESIATESKAGTTLANTRSINAAMPNLFTAVESLAKNNPLLNLSSLVNGSSANSSAGTGDMTANDTFSATVSTVVTAVNPTGTLTIKGDRRVRVNGENDTVHLSGVVRPQDIDSNDTIASAQVADLEVGISGEGQIRDKQGDGLGTRLFDWLWIF